jgi:hypothetical protein
MTEPRKPKRGGRITKAEEALMQERRAKALYWSVRGRTHERIAEMSRAENWEPWPYQSRQSVYEDISAALKEAKAERNAMAGEWIENELSKLDAMEEQAWFVLESLHYVVNQGEVVYIYTEDQPKTIKQGWARPKLDEETRRALEDAKARLGREPLQDNKPVLDALTILLKIAERRAKLLGLDAPIKKQIDVTSGENVDDRIANAFRELENLARGGQGATPSGGASPDIGDQVPNPGSAG